MSDEYCYEDSDGCPTDGWLTGHPLFVTCQLCIERFRLGPERERLRKQQDEHPRTTINTVHKGDRWSDHILLETVSLLYYDGPILDANVIDVHGSVLVELVAENGLLYQLDPWTTRMRLSIEDLKALIERAEAHAKKG